MDIYAKGGQFYRQVKFFAQKCERPDRKEFLKVRAL